MGKLTCFLATASAAFTAGAAAWFLRRRREEKHHGKSDRGTIVILESDVDTGISLPVEVILSIEEELDMVDALCKTLHASYLEKKLEEKVKELAGIALHDAHLEVLEEIGCPDPAVYHQDAAEDEHGHALRDAQEDLEEAICSQDLELKLDDKAKELDKVEVTDSEQALPVAKQVLVTIGPPDLDVVEERKSVSTEVICINLLDILDEDLTLDVDKFREIVPLEVREEILEQQMALFLNGLPLYE